MVHVVLPLFTSALDFYLLKSLFKIKLSDRVCYGLCVYWLKCQITAARWSSTQSLAWCSS